MSSSFQSITEDCHFPSPNTPLWFN